MLKDTIIIVLLGSFIVSLHAIINILYAIEEYILNKLYVLLIIKKCYYLINVIILFTMKMRCMLSIIYEVFKSIIHKKCTFVR